MYSNHTQRVTIITLIPPAKKMTEFDEQIQKKIKYLNDNPTAFPKGTLRLKTENGIRKRLRTIRSKKKHTQRDKNEITILSTKLAFKRVEDRHRIPMFVALLHNVYCAMSELFPNNASLEDKQKDVAFYLVLNDLCTHKD